MNFIYVYSPTKYMNCPDIDIYSRAMGMNSTYIYFPAKYMNMLHIEIHSPPK